MSAGVVAAALLVGCTVTEIGEPLARDREALTDAAAPFHALMRWDPLSDQQGLPVVDNMLPWPHDADSPADQSAIQEAVAAIAGDDLESIRFSTASGELVARSYEREIETGPDLTDEQALLEGVRPVLVAAGADPEQLRLDVSTLRAVGGEKGAQPVAHDVSKTVRIHRKLAGVNVSLDAGTASFGMDGRFIRISFRWRRLDYANSVLAVHGIESTDDVMAMLAESLAEEEIELRPSVEAIDVGTYYLAKPTADVDDDLWTVHLVGYAALRDTNGNGMGSEGMIPTYAFHLDGSGPLSAAD